MASLSRLNFLGSRRPSRNSMWTSLSGGRRRRKIVVEPPGKLFFRSRVEESFLSIVLTADRSFRYSGMGPPFALVYKDVTTAPRAHLTFFIGAVPIKFEEL